MWNHEHYVDLEVCRTVQNSKWAIEAEVCFGRAEVWNHCTFFRVVLVVLVVLAHFTSFHIRFIDSWFILIHSDSSQLPPHLVAELQTLGFHRGSGWSRWGWHEGEIFSGKSLSFFTHVEKERQKKDIADKFTHIPWTFVTFVDIRQFYTLHRMTFVHLWSHSACAAQRICTQPFHENGGSVLSAQSVVETHLCQTSCDVTYNTMTLKASQIKSMNESIHEYALWWTIYGVYSSIYSVYVYIFFMYKCIFKIYYIILKTLLRIHTVVFYMFFHTLSTRRCINSRLSRLVAW